MHLFQHKPTAVANNPFPTSSWIFIFCIGENLDFTGLQNVSEMLHLSILIALFRRGSKMGKPCLSQIYQLYFQSFYHRLTYNLSCRKMNPNLFSAIMDMRLKLNLKSMTGISPALKLLLLQLYHHIQIQPW